jgi:hypothetical protein
MKGHLPALIDLFVISFIIIYKKIKEVEIVNLPRHCCFSCPMETIMASERHHFHSTIINIVVDIAKVVEQ